MLRVVGDRIDTMGQPSAAFSVATAFVGLISELGVKMATGVTGGPIAPVVHALEDHPAIQWVHARTEDGATLMAVGAATAAGSPVAVVTTHGPGEAATHQGFRIARAEGVHAVLVTPRTTANQRERQVPQDGQPSADLLVRGALFDHVVTIETAAQLLPLAAELSAGFSRRGPYLAHIALASDLLTLPAAAVRVPQRRPGLLVADSATIAEAGRLLGTHPFVILAGRGARQAADLVRELSRVCGVPVVTTPGAKGVIDERGPAAAGVVGIGGTPGTEDRVRAHRPEVMLVLGSRLSQASVSPTLVTIPRLGLIHVDRDPAVIGRAWDVPTLGVESDVHPFLEAVLASGLLVDRPGVSDSLPHPPAPAGPARNGSIRPEILMQAVQQVVVDGSASPVGVEVGSIWPWATSCLRFSEPNRLRLETFEGAMGTAVEGGIGAAIATQEKVVVLTGDWSFDLSLPEVRTAIDLKAPVVWIVLQNYGGQMVLDGDRTIHGRTRSTAAFPPADLVGAVRAFGGRGRRVSDERSLVRGLREAMASAGPFLVEVVSDTSVMPPYGNRFDTLRRVQTNDIE